MTGIERSDVSNLFLHQGPDGLSLVVLHDMADDGHTHGSDSGGGAASFETSGLNSGSWVVRDDSGDIGTTDTSPDWSWATQQTDGGAWRGGLECGFTVTIEPAFNDAAEREPLSDGDIKKWHLLSGNVSEPDRIGLDLDKPVTIRCGGCVDG